jgi:hypothetical protein
LGVFLFPSLFPRASPKNHKLERCMGKGRGAVKSRAEGPLRSSPVGSGPFSVVGPASVMVSRKNPGQGEGQGIRGRGRGEVPNLSRSGAPW